MKFIDEYKPEYGVWPICSTLAAHGYKIASSTYYACKNREKTSTLCARKIADLDWKEKILALWQSSNYRYGVGKIWDIFHAQGIMIGKHHIRRLMRELGIKGKARGWHKHRKIKKDPVPVQFRFPDLVHRGWNECTELNTIWVADFTHITLEKGQQVYTSFVMDAPSRKIVGWRTCDSKETPLVISALDQAIHLRTYEGYSIAGVIHHSDAGSQYTSKEFAGFLEKHQIQGSIGSVGDAYDNSLMESMIGLYKTEVIHGFSWYTMQEIETATQKWVTWYNNERIHTKIGNINPNTWENNHKQHKHQAV